MKRTVLSCLAAVSAAAATVLFIYAFPEWKPALYFLSAALYVFTAGALTLLFAAEKPVKKALIAAAAYAAGFFGLVFLVNNVILHEKQSRTATVIVLVLNLVFFIVYYRLLSRGKERRRAVAACAFVLCALALAVYLFVICVLPEFPPFPKGPEVDLTGYELVFEDEFEGDSLNYEVWHDRALGERRNGFNSSGQAEVKDGNLILTAQYREDGEYGAGWYSGMVSLNQWYSKGYFEIRCKCNDGGGFWSAFWLQAQYPYDHEKSAGGPGGCEIDIFEAMAANARTKAKRDSVSINLHCNGGDDDPDNLDSLNVGHFRGRDIYTEYNTYGCMWTDDEYIFFLNGKECARSSHAKGVSQVPEEVIVSLEIPGEIDHEKDFTTQFIVDYVKIYQLP